MMEKVKQRILNLEREVVQDEKRMKEADERAANRPHMEGYFEVSTTILFYLHYTSHITIYYIYIYIYLQQQQLII
jgi:hypothetical protein